MQCEASLLKGNTITPNTKKFCYINGIIEYIEFKTSTVPMFTSSTFHGKVKIEDETVEWVIVWLAHDQLSFIETFCNTVPTPLGCSH